MSKNKSFSLVSFAVGALLVSFLTMVVDLVEEQPWDPQPRMIEVSFDAELDHRVRDTRDHFISALRNEIELGNDTSYEMIHALREMHDIDYPEFVGERCE